MGEEPPGTVRSFGERGEDLGEGMPPFEAPGDLESRWP
jgi:hypothetical protein